VVADVSYVEKGKQKSLRNLISIVTTSHSEVRHISPKMWSFTSLDRSGFWILYKRLEQGTFAWPIDEPIGPVEMRSTDLALLLAGVDGGAGRADADGMNASRDRPRSSCTADRLRVSCRRVR
jgi:hypothetical protein